MLDKKQKIPRFQIGIFIAPSDIPFMSPIIN